MSRRPKVATRTSRANDGPISLSSVRDLPADAICAAVFGHINAARAARLNASLRYPLADSRRSFLVAKLYCQLQLSRRQRLSSSTPKGALEENRQNQPVRYLNDNRRRGSCNHRIEHRFAWRSHGVSRILRSSSLDKHQLRKVFSARPGMVR